MSFFFGVYRWILTPLLRFAFWLLATCGHRKIGEGWRMRARAERGEWPWLEGKEKTRPIWIHCASGEFEYAKPVITRLKIRSPETPILVTFFSPSIAKAAKQFRGVDFACPSPWESPSVLQKFIHYHEPQALLIARTDTWPEMLRQAHEAKITTLLFSATLPPTSGRAKGLGRWMSRAAFQYLDQIFCVSQQDFETFSSLGFAARTLVSGDTRYDQVLARLETPKPLRDELFREVPRESCLVAGSTWEEDEAVLIEAAAKLKSQFSFVLVPHEPTEAHLADLEKKLKSAGLHSVRYSSAQAETSWREKVLLVDQIGLPAELYQKSAYAFVGGSFRKTVHSVMEPLAAGCLTFVGPLHQNNREATEFRDVASEALDINCVTEIRDATDLVGFLLKRPATPASAAEIRRQILARSGRSEQVVDWVLGKLNKN